MPGVSESVGLGYRNQTLSWGMGPNLNLDHQL